MNKVCTPFIFDDPISSLDQDYEEATAGRLAELSKNCQVIVFTHRLSLLFMLEEAAKKKGVGVKIISLENNLGDLRARARPLPAQKPKQAVNALANERLAKARKVWQNEGNPAYAVESKALCSDIRITIERLIECELLAEVVQRFRRPIQTQNKIEKLANIRLEDCQFFDAMMTKYSRYEHSQPDEAPVSLPEPDELAADLKQLADWLAEFSGAYPWDGEPKVQRRHHRHRASRNSRTPESCFPLTPPRSDDARRLACPKGGTHPRFTRAARLSVAVGSPVRATP